MMRVYEGCSCIGITRQYMRPFQKKGLLSIGSAVLVSQATKYLLQLMYCIQVYQSGKISCTRKQEPFRSVGKMAAIFPLLLINNEKLLPTPKSGRRVTVEGKAFSRTSFATKISIFLYVVVRFALPPSAAAFKAHLLCLLGQAFEGISFLLDSVLLRRGWRRRFGLLSGHIGY